MMVTNVEATKSEVTSDARNTARNILNNAATEKNQTTKVQKKKTFYLLDRGNNKNLVQIFHLRKKCPGGSLRPSISYADHTGLLPPPPEIVSNNHVLSQEEIDSFWEKGYLHIDPQIPEEILNRIERETNEFLCPNLAKGEECEGRIQDAWMGSPAAHSVAVWPRVMNMLKQLYGVNPRLFQTLNFNRPTGQGAHPDSVHFASMPENLMAGVWIALEDIDMENGPLFYYPESAKLRTFWFKDFGLVPDLEDNEHNVQLYYKFVAALVDRYLKDSKKEFGIMKKGEALIWSNNIVHGGHPPVDPSRTRKSQVTHVYFEGSRYWIPMRSTPDKIFWKNVEFIPKYEDDPMELPKFMRCS